MSKGDFPFLLRTGIVRDLRNDSGSGKRILYNIRLITIFTKVRMFNLVRQELERAGKSVSNAKIAMPGGRSSVCCFLTH